MEDVVLESKLDATSSSRRTSIDNEPTLLQREVVFEKPLRQ